MLNKGRSLNTVKSLPPSFKKYLPLAALSFCVLVFDAGCSNLDGVESSATLIADRDEIFNQIDVDSDGVIDRADLELAAAFSDLELVGARYPGGTITIGEVLTSLDEMPSSKSSRSDILDPSVVVARLTSMLRLRLSAIALGELGFDLDLAQSDVEINEAVQSHLEGDFEVYARDKAFAEDPRLVKFATPHCITVLGVASEIDSELAIGRILGGEDPSLVADEVNLPTISAPGGDMGCANLLDWAENFGEMAAPLSELGAGEFSKPSLTYSEFSYTGELWISLYVSEIKSAEIEKDQLGPFGNELLASEVLKHASSVEVDSAIGIWSSSTVSISLN